ncbi:protein arginine N-methyltransferase 5 isoform X2 [Xylocopa sonorina]|uniref:protein arginine N-methyltransferase 5 isoform X2 n=1 Tax=Xylocopa sonorina TaxID=1818115 RepID=UPI00403AA2F8
MSNQRSVSCGLDFCAVPDLSNCLFTANSSKYEFICVPLVHPLFKREFLSGVAKERIGPFTRPDILLSSSDWNTLIIGKLSPYIRVDSKDPTLRKNSEETLKQELTLASHLGLVGVTFKLTKGIEHNANLARVIYDKVSSACALQMWVQVPMENPIKQAYSYREESCDTAESPWEWWNAFRIICDYNRKIGVALIVSHDLPDPEEGCEADGPFERYARGYEDFLQCPLQPLMDNLESQTYETFEKDPIKYAQYQTAIYQAICDIVDKTEDKQKKIIIMVVGAGRGPLVHASLNASELANQPVKIYAVEKNPNAVLTLQALEKDLWDDKVTVVSCDMREWNPPENADIIVSELLGSFGDNELSPECLDGVQRFLKADGICIPTSYTSYIAPVQSSKLYNEVRQCRPKDKHPLSHFETLYVVHLQNKYDIAKPQPLFTFNHPNSEKVIDNSRYSTKVFKVRQNCVLHGFSGYFDTVLFKNVTLSIEPSTHSPGMFSWFPIFFPIKEPVQLKAGDQVVVHFWRQCNSKNVWYEWCISEPIPGPVHNPGGRSYTIGL